MSLAVDPIGGSLLLLNQEVPFFFFFENGV